MVNLPSKADGTDANVQFRGVGPAAWALRPQLKIVEGRKFGAGPARDGGRPRRAAAVRAASKSASSSSSPTRCGRWSGVFESGDSHDSELWADADVLGPAYQRQAFQSVTVKLDGKNGFKQLQGGARRRPAPEARRVDHARLLRQAVRGSDEADQASSAS